MYPSTTIALRDFAIAGRALSMPYSDSLFLKTPSGEFRYFGFESAVSARAPKPITLPRASRIGNVIRDRNLS